MEIPSEELPFRMQPGERFAGKYLIRSVLGTGAMGVVVAAVHEQLGQPVAIKLLSVDRHLQTEGISRFLREARAAASLHSEHVARVVDVDVDETGRHYIVMEHLEGTDLLAITSRGEVLPVTTGVGFILQACEAIAEAHALGIVHRHLKPANLFLSRRLDGTPLIKVLDFGISKFADTEGLLDGGAPSLSSSRTLLGTPTYMSPEQIRTPRAVDGRSDIWALGVILYQLLTGEAPFVGATVADIIASILTVVPPTPTALRREIPEEVSAVLLGCLNKNPDRRIPNVGLLAERLRPWAPPWARDAGARAARIAAGRIAGPIVGEAAEAAGNVAGNVAGEVARAAPEDTRALPPLAQPVRAPARARVSLAIAEVPEAPEVKPVEPRPAEVPRSAVPRRWGHLAAGGGLGLALLVSAILLLGRSPAPATPDPPRWMSMAPARAEQPGPPTESDDKKGSGQKWVADRAPPAEDRGIGGAAARAENVHRAGATGPKHLGPGAVGSVIHMEPRLPSGAPKREPHRPGARASSAPPSSDPLSSRR